MPQSSYLSSDEGDIGKGCCDRMGKPKLFNRQIATRIIEKMSGK
jgi:hypothetical protein